MYLDIRVMDIIITALMIFSLLLVDRDTFFHKQTIAIMVKCMTVEYYTCHRQQKPITCSLMLWTLDIFCLSLIFFRQNVFRNQVGSMDIVFGVLPPENIICLHCNYSSQYNKPFVCSCIFFIICHDSRRYCFSFARRTN